MNSGEYDKNIERIKEHVSSYPDFPKKDILFRDIFSVLRNPEIFTLLREVLIAHINTLLIRPTCIVGLDSRGFLIGPLIALELEIPFVPIRKKGKLPGPTRQVHFKLEYGEDCFEIQEGSIQPNDAVLIVDDLLATGGSLRAACDLVEQMRGNVIECLVIMELSDLQGRQKIPNNVYSLIKY